MIKDIIIHCGEASQRAIAKVVGVGQATVSRDLTPSDSNESPAHKKPNENTPVDPSSDSNESPSRVSGPAAATYIAEKETRADHGRDHKTTNL